MTRPRKQQRAMITQCFRLMLSSGVLRPASMDPGLLARPWSPPPPKPAPVPERQPQGAAWFRRTAVGMLAFLTITLFTASLAQAVRVKDVATIEGVRENQLIGYGLVVGLDRTGDQVIGGQFTIQAMMSMLNKMGINLVIDPIQLLTRNIASVMVTAKLPPFVKPGMTLDAVVSSMANAKSLQGGTLLSTPLKAPNQQVFAVAQGPVSIGGFLGGTGGAGGATITKNHQAAGVVPAGAIVEKELVVDIENWDSVSVLLRHPDFTTAIRTAEAIDGTFGKGTAVPVNAGLVKTSLPATFHGRVVEYIATMEGLDVTVDVAAKVVVNERTGTVVLGEHVPVIHMRDLAWQPHDFRQEHAQRVTASGSVDRLDPRANDGHSRCADGSDRTGVATDRGRSNGDAWRSGTGTQRGGRDSARSRGHPIGPAFCRSTSSES
jgi:flagellar P-ring protein precursor FlgI